MATTNGAFCHADDDDVSVSCHVHYRAHCQQISAQDLCTEHNRMSDRREGRQELILSLAHKLGDAPGLLFPCGSQPRNRLSYLLSQSIPNNHSEESFSVSKIHRAISRGMTTHTSLEKMIGVIRLQQFLSSCRSHKHNSKMLHLRHENKTAPGCVRFSFLPYFLYQLSYNPCGVL